MSDEEKMPDKQLKDAFQLFNQLSNKLAVSYGNLEEQVAELSVELTEARNERLKQIDEKERLAKRLEGLLDALPAGIIVVDTEGRINQANPVAHNMFGNELIGLLWQTVAKKSFVSDGDELCLHDGRWISVSANPLGDDTGKIILVTDITETHVLQETVNRQQRLTSLGEMIASLAHQIRTPLATALLYLSNLGHSMADEGDRVRFSDKARERLHHLERMVNDMLIFARGGVTESEYFSVGQFMEQLQQLLEPQFVDSNATLIVDTQIPAAPLRGNWDALLGAFQNIATNAIESGGETPILQINVAWSEDAAVEFTFKDNGIGIPDKIKDRILEPFFTTRSNGTGLGLSVVNTTVTGHQGTLDIVSEEGNGSQFIVKLPLPPQHRMLPSGTVNNANEVNVESSENLQVPLEQPHAKYKEEKIHATKGARL